MRLTTEELPEIQNVTAAQIEQILGEDVFGGFVVLAASDEVFIQALCVWEPRPETSQFLAQTGSAPFRLEYREEGTGRLFATNEKLTIAQVTQALVEFLNGNTDWRDRWTWREVEFRRGANY